MTTFTINVGEESTCVGFTDADGIARTEWLWKREHGRVKGILFGLVKRNRIYEQPPKRKRPRLFKSFGFTEVLLTIFIPLSLLICAIEETLRFMFGWVRLFGIGDWLNRNQLVLDNETDTWTYKRFQN